MFKVSVLDIESAAPIFESLVRCVILPGAEGELAIMAFHQPIILKLKAGVVAIDNKRIAVKKGIARMQDNKLTVLVERIKAQARDAEPGRKAAI